MVVPHVGEFHVYCVELVSSGNVLHGYAMTSVFYMSCCVNLMQSLLQYGADPRPYADDGQTPEQVKHYRLYKGYSFKQFVMFKTPVCICVLCL